MAKAAGPHWHLGIAPKATVHRAQGSGYADLADAQHWLREAATNAARNTSMPMVQHGTDLFVVGDEVYSLVTCSDSRCRPQRPNSTGTEVAL